MPLKKRTNQSSICETKPCLTIEDTFKEDEVVCMICGKGGMKTLARHLNFAHNLKPGQYRKQFGLKSTQPLTSKSYSNLRKQFVIEKGSLDFLPKARSVWMAILQGNKGGVKPVETNINEGRAKRPYRKLNML